MITSCCSKTFFMLIALLSSLTHWGLNDMLSVFKRRVQMHFRERSFGIAIQVSLRFVLKDPINLLRPYWRRVATLNWVSIGLVNGLWPVQLDIEGQISVILCSKFEIFYQKTAFENVVCKTSAILYRPQCVKAITGIRSAMLPCLRYFENFSSHWKRQVSLECCTNRKTCLFHVHRWVASVVGVAELFCLLNERFENHGLMASLSTSWKKILQYMWPIWQAMWGRCFSHWTVIYKQNIEIYRI